MSNKKTENDWISVIVQVVRAAQAVGIDNIIIEPDCIRGIDDAKTIVLFQNEDVHQLSIGSIGMNRIGVFMQRYNIISNQDNPSFEAIKDKERGYIRSIIMKSDDTKVEYRCGNPDTIQAPKKINDTPKFRIMMPRSSSLLMKNAQAAMSSELVQISNDDDGVCFQILDINNDGFTHRFGDNATIINDDDTDTKFVHKYGASNILNVLSTNEDTMLEIGEKGIITAQVNHLNVLILPQM